MGKLGMSPIVGLVLMLVITLAFGAFITHPEIIEKFSKSAPYAMLELDTEVNNNSIILLIKNKGGDQLNLDEISVLVSNGKSEKHTYPFLYDKDGILSVSEEIGVPLQMSVSKGEILKVKVVHEPSGLVIFEGRVVVGGDVKVTQTPVPPNSSYLVFNINKNKWYETIGDAIKDADNGDRILVYPNYDKSENIIINKNLIIEAVEIGKAKIDGYVLIKSDDVTLKGFEIKDNIYIYGDNCELSYNTIENYVYVYKVKDAKILHNTIKAHRFGIRVFICSNIEINSNSISGSFYGIYIYRSNTITVTSNKIIDVVYGVIAFRTPDLSIEHNNIKSSYRGIAIEWCDNAKIKDNDVHSRYYSITIYSSNNNKIEGNKLKSDIRYQLHAVKSRAIYVESNKIEGGRGLYCYECMDSAFSGNNIEHSKYGVYLYGGENNTIIGNQINGTSRGVLLERAKDCIVTKNKIINSISYSIFLRSSENNLIYDNVFNSNRNVYISGNYYNTWNVTKQSGTNILGGNYIGGNAWLKPDGSGYSQVCSDRDRDGICDEPYKINSQNIDYLPLKY